MAANPEFDAIVVGAGHNGLTCAAYLTRAGLSVLVLEAAPRVGGAAVNDEIHPGFTVPACAHILHLLHPRVAADLELGRNGLELACKAMATVALDPNGRHIAPSPDDGSVASHSKADAEALPAFQARLGRFAGALQPFLAAIPPRLDGAGWSDSAALLRLGWAVRRLGREDMREFLRVIAMNAADLLDETFESDLLKGAFALDSVLGARLGPRSPGSVLTLLYRFAGECGGVRGALGLPRGGMGAVTRALAAAASRAQVRTGAAVARILVENDRAVGAVLESGEEFRARCVISNADPRTTFLSLLGAEHLDTGFVRRVRNIRMRGIAAKLNLALDAAPTFTGLDPGQLGARLLIAPSIDYVENAFNPCKYRAYSDEPAIEITIPSAHDPTLAPAGKHVLSAIVQYAPYDLEGGWEASRDAFADKVIATIARHAPDLPDKIVARRLITPADLERDFRMTGGHWHHGELALDQLFMLRPVPGWAQYRTPVAGLYLCGAGAHPGGGVMGAAGYNAARQAMATEAFA